MASQNNIVRRQRAFELWWRSIGPKSANSRAWSPTALTVDAFNAGYEAALSGACPGDGCKGCIHCWSDSETTETTNASVQSR